MRGDIIENWLLYKDTGLHTNDEELKRHAVKYQNRLENQPKELAKALLI